APCLRCSRGTVPERGSSSPEDEARLKELQKLLGKLEPHSDREAPKDKKAKPGSLDCPNSTCHGGSMLWENGKTNPCRVCDAKGSIKCIECEGGSAPCPGCAGTKKRPMVCWDCAGLGLILCPSCKLSASAGRCLWCKGSGALDCFLCKA